MKEEGEYLEEVEQLIQFMVKINIENIPLTKILWPARKRAPEFSGIGVELFSRKNSTSLMVRPRIRRNAGNFDSLKFGYNKGHSGRHYNAYVLAYKPAYTCVFCQSTRELVFLLVIL